MVFAAAAAAATLLLSRLPLLLLLLRTLKKIRTSLCTVCPAARIVVPIRTYEKYVPQRGQDERTSNNKNKHYFEHQVPVYIIEERAILNDQVFGSRNGSHAAEVHTTTHRYSRQGGGGGDGPVGEQKHPEGKPSKTEKITGHPPVPFLYVGLRPSSPFRP